MEPALLSPLAAWESFYVIVGSSAGALTGLQFVVMALVADGHRRSSRSDPEGLQRQSESIDAFGTPNIVHFCAVLLGSAILSAPWQRLSSVAVALASCAAAGVVYTMIVIRRARRQTGYEPVLEDWIWHAALPLIAYVAALAGALVLGRRPSSALFAIAAAALLLLFIGIHNAWDTVTYIATEWLPRQDDSGSSMEDVNAQPTQERSSK